MRIELDTEAGVMKLNGITIQLDTLDFITQPKPEYVYQFWMERQNVIVRQWRIEDLRFPADQEPMSYGTTER